MKKLAVIAMTAAAMLSAGAVIPAQIGGSDIVASAATYENDALASYAKQVAAIVNRERAAQGLSPLKLSDELCDAANIRAAEIQISFSHTRPNGSSCFTALTEAGIRYRYAAENIAYGQKTPEQVMNSWMNSSGHRANILSNKVEYIGIGVAYKNGTYYWTQFFAAADGLSGSVVGEDKTPQTTTSMTTAPTETTTSRTVTTRPSETTTRRTVTTRPAETTTRRTVTTRPAETTTRRTVTTRPSATTTRRTTTTSEPPATTTRRTTTVPIVTTAPPSGSETYPGCMNSMINDLLSSILPNISCILPDCIEDAAAPDQCEQLENIVDQLLMCLGCNR